MLTALNPAAAELQRDPFRQPRSRGGVWRRLFGIGDHEGRIAVDDPLTIAQLKALLWIHRNQQVLAAKRRAVQQARRRTDAEIFEKFPLRIVATYPGDERFDSDYFQEFLQRAPRLARMTLQEIFS
jgi:hypothetical protein